MSDAARRLAHEWAAAPRGPRRPPGGVCDCDCASVVWSRSEIQTRVGVRLALLAVAGPHRYGLFGPAGGRVPGARVERTVFSTRRAARGPAGALHARRVR